MSNDKPIFSKTPPRKLEDLNLIDGFLFQEMLTQKDTGEEFCRILLRAILGYTIRNVKIIPQKSFPSMNTARRGIRLDIYIKALPPHERMPGTQIADARIVSDVCDIVSIDACKKPMISKQMFHHLASTDTHLRTTEADCRLLSDVTTIVILPCDPFEQNRMLHTFRVQCAKNAAVPYDGGSTKIFLYTKGVFASPNQKLADMLSYMEKSTDSNVTDQDTEALHQLVYKIKHKPEVKLHYMKSQGL